LFDKEKHRSFEYDNFSGLNQGCNPLPRSSGGEQGFLHCASVTMRVYPRCYDLNWQKHSEVFLKHQEVFKQRQPHIGGCLFLGGEVAFRDK